MTADPRELGRAALAARAGEADHVDVEALGDAIVSQFEAGALRWPSVPLQARDFAAFVGARLSEDRDPVEETATLQGPDLYLTCACLGGSEAAAARFREYVFSAVRRAVAHVAPDATEDVINRLYDRLFLSDGDNQPRIDGYRGLGDLRRWVSVVACRIAIDGRRRDQTANRIKSNAIDRMVNEIQSMELTYLRGIYRDEFREAFAHAVGGLDERQRNVLRYQLEGLTADQVGRLYNVHRVTVARWLSRIRETLLEQTREALRAKLGLNPKEADSILRLVEGEVSLSLNRLLATPAET